MPIFLRLSPSNAILWRLNPLTLMKQGLKLSTGPRTWYQNLTLFLTGVEENISSGGGAIWPPLIKSLISHVSIQDFRKTFRMVEATCKQKMTMFHWKLFKWQPFKYWANFFLDTQYNFTIYTIQNSCLDDTIYLY